MQKNVRMTKRPINLRLFLCKLEQDKANGGGDASNLWGSWSNTEDVEVNTEGGGHLHGHMWWCVSVFVTCGVACICCRSYWTLAVYACGFTCTWKIKTEYFLASLFLSKSHGSASRDRSGKRISLKVLSTSESIKSLKVKVHQSFFCNEWKISLYVLACRNYKEKIKVLLEIFKCF